MIVYNYIRLSWKTRGSREEEEDGVLSEKDLTRTDTMVVDVTSIRFLSTENRNTQNIPIMTPVTNK